MDVDEGSDDGVYAIYVKVDPSIIIDIKGGRGSVIHKVIQFTLRNFRLDYL